MPGIGDQGLPRWGGKCRNDLNSPSLSFFSRSPSFASPLCAPPRLPPPLRPLSSLLSASLLLLIFCYIFVTIVTFCYFDGSPYRKLYFARIPGFPRFPGFPVFFDFPESPASPAEEGRSVAAAMAIRGGIL